MKTKNIILVTVLSLNGLHSMGQLKKKESVSPVSVVSSEDIFKKGVVNFNLNQVLSFEPGTTKRDGEKTGNYFNYNGRIEANYFFIDHFGIGAGINLKGQKTTTEILTSETIQQVDVITGHGNVLYGTRLGEVVNLITKASVGGGKKKTYNDDGYGEYEDVIKYLNFGITAGTPLQLNRNVYFTPSVGWYYNRAKQDNYTQVTNGVVVNMNMDFFMGKGDDECDLSENPFPISQRYNQGDFHLGSRMFGRFKTGGITTTYEGEGGYEYKDNFGRGNVSGYGLYYVIDNLAAGLGVDYTGERIKSKETEYKDSYCEYTINPIVRYHIPVDNYFRNFYVEGSAGVGGSKSKTEHAEGTNEQKSSIFKWQGAIGFNYYVSEHFSLSPVVGYGNWTSKDKDTDVKTSANGIYAGIGWNYHITPN